ncbi:hypothetical protein DL93DRAFT_2150429 [Clavulina sp. PMI_390]|nr:hypothetical protein DL93DRAFT_2150429 [Clavulina sp. PMI_390]
MLPHELIYVGNVNVNLICCICCMPFTNPTTTTTCNHTFCKDCITAALTFNAECPVDRRALSEPDLVPAGTIVRNLVDELVVKCPNSTYGCTHTCQRQLLGNHLSSECLFISSQCEEVGCQEIVLRGDAEKHAQTCPHRIVACEACSASVKFKDLEYHESQCPAADVTCSHCNDLMPRSQYKAHLDTCPDVRLPCAQSTFGCPWSGRRATLDEHSKSCPYESIKGFFAINNARLSSLEKENSSLRHQITRLENNLASALREVDNAKHSLGPWYRRPTDPEVTTPLPRQERPTRRRLSVPLTTASFPRESDDSEAGDSDGYFSPTLGSPSTSAAGPSVPHPTSPDQYLIHLPNNPNQSINATSYVDEFGIPTQFPMGPNAAGAASYPQAQSRVAPIDLATSLEGCLNSLRASVVTIASSVDSLERRQDLSLATEKLRMREDVASLRAIVHGLRMQVHSMMMERNLMASGRSGSGEGDAGEGFPMGPLYAPGIPLNTSVTASIESSGVSRPYYPSMGPPSSIQISQMTSMRRSMENKL